MIRQLDALPARARSPPATARARHGLRDRHRRLGRQPAAETRPSGSRTCSRAAPSTPTAASTRRLRASALPAGRRPRRRRGRRSTPASRTTTTTRRAPDPTSTTPTTRAAPSTGWPELPGPHGPRPAAVQAAGLDMPSYVAFGNHDGLVQGNQAANRGFEEVATGCVKPMHRRRRPSSARAQDLSPASLHGLRSPIRRRSRSSRPTRTAATSARPSTSRSASKARRPTGTVSATSTRPRAAASNGAAGYYSWSPVPGHPVHRARHGLRGRRDRPLGRRQRRRSPVPMARGRAAGGHRRATSS